MPWFSQKHMMFCLFGLTLFATASGGEPLRILPVGPGPEDLVAVTWPGGRGFEPLVVTSISERRRPRAGASLVAGFMFIRMKDGVPVLVNDKPQLPAGAQTIWPWQGLSWQPHCKLAGGAGVLAATRTEHITKGDRRPAGGAVDLFVWDDAATSQPRLRLLRSTPVMSNATKPNQPATFNFNAVALARDGSLYASVMSMLPNSRLPEARPGEEALSGKAVQNGAVYMLRPRATAWTLAASNLNGANGIVLSRDERTLFVASSLHHRILAFQRDPATGVLSGAPRRLDLPWLSVPDNLRMTEDGETLTATATGLLPRTGLYLIFKALFGHAPGLGSRGHVYAWERPLSAEPVCRRLFTWPRPVNTPSGSVQLKDWWLAGQIFDEGIACRRDDRSHNR